MIDMSNRMMYHINSLNTQNEKISYQMASGKAIKQGSENSLLHSSIINLEDKLRVTERLQLQIQKTRALNDTADSNIAEMKLSLDNIKTDLLKSLNAGMDRSDKLALAANLKGIREGLLDRVNTQIDGEYLFTGSVTYIQTMQKDTNYIQNGKVEFAGDGFLREVAVQPGSYRDRGVTAYDVIFYNTDSATTGEEFVFNETDRIIDENGNEWKLDSTKTKIQKYDKNGDLEVPLVEYTITSSTAKVVYPADVIDRPATYTIHPFNMPEGSRFFAKRNYFDDLNIIINALEGYTTQLDGTKNTLGTGAPNGQISDDEVNTIIREFLDRTSQQYDATNVGHGELGGRNAVFEVAYEKLQAQSTQYNILIQETGGADLAKLAMESKSLELTYQSLYSTIAKMNDLSLVKFMS